jgi:formylmethanofuran:tetrahydromethanopterin formyltransferase
LKKGKNIVMKKVKKDKLDVTKIIKRLSREIIKLPPVKTFDEKEKSNDKEEIQKGLEEYRKE